MASVTDAAAFATVSAAVATARAEAQAQHAGLDGDLEASIATRSDLRRAGDETRAELASLAVRQNNLPAGEVEVRTQLCAELGMTESELPFAGELLDVAEEFSAWRGAAERVLRGFALSLLVPQQHYDRVARWVNEHRLTYRRSDGRMAGSGWCTSGCRSGAFRCSRATQDACCFSLTPSTSQTARSATTCVTSWSGGPTSPASTRSSSP